MITSNCVLSYLHTICYNDVTVNHVLLVLIKVQKVRKPCLINVQTLKIQVRLGHTLWLDVNTKISQNC